MLLVTDFDKISNEVLAIDEAMRYFGITDREGTIIYNKMKKGKTSLKSPDQESRFAVDLSIVKKIQEGYDEQLGKVTSIHLIREKLHQLIYHVGDFMVYVTCEREIDDHHLLQIDKKTKSIIQQHIG